MAEKYYPQTDSEDQIDESDPKDENESGASTEAPSKESTLVPETIFEHTPEVGDVCKFKVVANHSGEVEIEYVKDKPEESDQSDSSDSQDSGDMSIADSMKSGKMGY